MKIVLYNKESGNPNIEIHYKCVTFFWYELSPKKELDILNREYENGWELSHKTKNGFIFYSYSFFFKKS